MRVFHWALIGFFALSASGCPKPTPPLPIKAEATAPDQPAEIPCWSQIPTDGFQLTAEVQEDLDTRLAAPAHAIVRQCNHAWTGATSGSCSDQIDQACDDACSGEHRERCKGPAHRPEIVRDCHEAVLPKFIETMKHCEGWTLDNHGDLKPPATSALSPAVQGYPKSSSASSSKPSPP